LELLSNVLEVLFSNVRFKHFLDDWQERGQGTDDGQRLSVGGSDHAPLSDTTPNAAIYWTFNGTTPTIASTRYTGAIYVGNSETLKAIAVAPGLAVSTVTSVTYSIGTAPTSTATPQFSLTPRTYAATQTVTITDSTANAAIYWTSNGTTPTTASARYTTGITVANSETLKAIAVAPGLAQSAIASASSRLGQGSLRIRCRCRSPRRPT
jgi:hypothetical protein